MAFRWRADDDPNLNAGLVALSLLGDLPYKPYILVIFQVSGGRYDPRLMVLHHRRA